VMERWSRWKKREERRLGCVLWPALSLRYLSYMDPIIFSPKLPNVNDWVVNEWRNKDLSIQAVGFM